MVDTADSKSAEGNLMPVRVRPLVPQRNQGFTVKIAKPFSFAQIIMALECQHFFCLCTSALFLLWAILCASNNSYVSCPF